MKPRQPLPLPQPQASPWAGTSVREPAARIPPATQKAKRTRNWEAQKKAQGIRATTYRLPEALRDAVRLIAKDRSVTIDDLARYFLQYAVDAYAAGELELHPKPREGRFTL